MHISSEQFDLIQNNFSCIRLSSSKCKKSFIDELKVDITAEEGSIEYIKQKSSEHLLGIIKDSAMSIDAQNEEAYYVIICKNKIALIFSIQNGCLYDGRDKVIQQTRQYYFIEDCIKARKDIDNNINVKQSIDFLNKTPFSNVDVSQLKIIKQLFLKNHPQVKLKKRDIDDKKSFHFVWNTYSAVELVLFWKNPSFKPIWNKLIKGKNFPDANRYSMSDILFWFFIAEKIKSITTISGCKYVYLFAADSSPNMRLIAHYNKLGFTDDKTVSSLKPSFDFNCKFMCQTLADLDENKKSFLQNFNLDSDEVLA